MQLYDIIKKKKINVDSIDLNVKNDIINNKLRPLSNKEYKSIKKTVLNKNNYNKYINEIKSKLSNDNNIIPLYDINNNKIFLNNKKDVYYLIKKYKFRPLNIKLIKFIKDNELNNNNNNIINIINLFDFDILEKLLLKFIFYNTKEIGKDLTYLLNPAYIKFLNINPFLKRSSIINVALNVGIIKHEQIKSFKNKVDELYSKIKTYLFNKSEILSHMDHITKNNMTKIINFYTMYGAFFLNNYLRKKKNIYYDDNIINQIKYLNNNIRNSPSLNTKKIIFRFIKEDFFLQELDVGDIYIENSFMSCTRKPNINSINEEFGFILLKIILPPNIKGCCLCIESDSVFSNEKEIILAPGSKLQLKSIDNDVDFFIFGKNNQRNIKKKYEFEFIGFDTLKIPQYDKISIPEIDFVKNNIDGDNLEEKIDFFWENYGRLVRRFNIILPNGNKKLLYCNYYNSTDTYANFFQYKIPDGFFMYSYNDNHEIDIFIEFGDIMIVNFPSQHISIKSNTNIKLIVSLISYGFRINKIFFYPDFIPVSMINKGNILFTSRIYLNSILYSLIYNKKMDHIVYEKYKINEYLNSEIKENNINYNLQKYLPTSSYSELIKNILLKNSFDIKYINISLPKKIINSYFEYNPYNHLLNKNIIYNIPNISSKYVNRRVLKSTEFETIETNNFRNIVK